MVAAAIAGGMVGGAVGDMAGRVVGGTAGGVVGGPAGGEIGGMSGAVDRSSQLPGEEKSSCFQHVKTYCQWQSRLCGGGGGWRNGSFLFA